ncbi:MAG TPA: transglycosylase SLT domain-containing protein [Burkholderiaceae bacterium]|nr:transglycosylase SLT domain-containing protein [Burkholderiaceae bacterium]
MTLRRATALIGLLLLMAGCATAPQDNSVLITQAPVSAASSDVPASAPASGASAPDAAASDAQASDAADAAEAAGKPNDPLRPDGAVVEDDASAHRDLWARIRRGFAMPDLDTDLVHMNEQWYASRPDYVQRMTERSSRYLYHVVEEIERRGMPTELALLPFIESAFNPQAMSVAKASGMWQFVPSTGKDYDLKQNIFRDDRRDVLASTRAALDYLQRLYGMFGDWQLALAAYNWGEGSVQRAIARNQRAGLPTDYLSLSMPLETRGYVPKLQAVKNIISRPQEFGLSLPDIENHPDFLSVPIQRDIDSAVVARLAGMPLSEFQALNPSLNKPVILAAGTPQVLLPYDNANAFVRNLPSHRGPLATWTAWLVPRTMKPADAAKQVGMSEASLREVNHIPARMLIRGGSTLLVPRSERRAEDVSPHVADNAVMTLAPEVQPHRRVTLKAGKSDSVASIAARYRVSVTQVAQWNNVAAHAKFARGQSIVVYVPPSAKATQSGGSRASKATHGTRASASSKATSRKSTGASTKTRVASGDAPKAR